jgi:C-terminal processing protease CtpA/Prc
MTTTFRKIMLLSTILLTACSSPSQMLVGPHGDIRRCASAGFGLMGATLAKHSFNNCVEDFRNEGYLPVEEAGTIGIQLSAADAKTATVTVVKPNSPAAQAGILVGDQIVKVNGLVALDREAAKTMMFGKAGDNVNITVSRNGTEMTFQVQLAARVAASD